MTAFPLLISCLVLLVVLANAGKHLDNGLIFEDIKIESLDVKKIQQDLAFISLTDTVVEPTQSPTTEDEFTIAPTAAPSATPTAEPTLSPTEEPSAYPTAFPTAIPTVTPSAVPSAVPSATPSAVPSATPSAVPSATPSAAPTPAPSVTPTLTPTAVPTRAPSATPVPTFTPAPTAGTNQGVVVKAAATVGMSSSDFNADPANGVAFGETIATVLSIDSTNVVVGTAYSPTTAPTSRMRRNLQGSSAVVPFTITLASTSDIGAPNADSAVTAITTTLSTAVSDGTFALTLSDIAGASNLTTLADAPVSGVEVTGTEVIDNSNDKKTLSSGEVAGTVIGVIAGVALLSALLYYFLNSRRSSLDGDRTPKYQDETQEVYRELGLPDESNMIKNGPTENSLVVASDADMRV